MYERNYFHKCLLGDSRGCLITFRFNNLQGTLNQLTVLIMLDNMWTCQRASQCSADWYYWKQLTYEFSLHRPEFKKGFLELFSHEHRPTQKANSPWFSIYEQIKVCVTTHGYLYFSYSLCYLGNFNTGVSNLFAIKCHKTSQKVYWKKKKEKNH